MQSLWMLVASAMFAVMGSFVKLAVEHQASLAQVVLFRGVPSVILLLIWARSRKLDVLPTIWRPHLWRNLAGISSMWLGFYAIGHLPLATATSLTYTAPLFIAGWVLVTGVAKRDPICIASVGFGFLGVLAILRPSIDPEHWLPAVMGLGAGGLSAVAMMQIRALGRLGEAEWRTVLIFSFFVCLSSLIGLIVGPWGQADMMGWLALLGIGLTGLLGQMALTRAFGLGSPLLSAALQYSTILFAAGIGMFYWGERIDDLALFGMACVIAAGLLSTWRTMANGKSSD